MIDHPVTLLRPKQAMERLGLPRTPFYEDVRNGLLPPLVKIGPRASAIPSNEVDAVISYRIAGKTSEDIKSLVIRLVDGRQELAGGD